MIKLKDILNEGKQPLNEVMFYGKAKVVLTSNAKDSQLPSQYVEFNFNYVNADYLGKGPTLICIPKSSKDLDKIDTLGSISKDDITKQLAELASKKKDYTSNYLSGSPNPEFEYESILDEIQFTQELDSPDNATRESLMFRGGRDLPGVNRSWYN